MVVARSRSRSGSLKADISLPAMVIDPESGFENAGNQMQERPSCPNHFSPLNATCAFSASVKRSTLTTLCRPPSGDTNDFLQFGNFKQRHGQGDGLGIRGVGMVWTIGRAFAAIPRSAPQTPSLLGETGSSRSNQ